MAGEKSFEGIRDFALMQGFDRVIAMPPQRFARWQAAMDTVGPDHRALSLSADPFSILPSATAILIMIKGYVPFSDFPRGFGHVPNYYLLTQHTYKWTQAVAAFIEAGSDAKAVASPKLPHRSSAILGGAGCPGFNQLLFIPGFGSYTNIALILTDAFKAPVQELAAPVPALCNGCGACARACPTQAIKGDGTWDYTRCLRHHMAANDFPEESRSKLTSLLGCDICQNACPVNQRVCAPASAPDEIVSAFELGAVVNLKNDAPLTKHIGELVGKNLVRGNRLVNQALILCVNQGLTEHKRTIKNLLRDENPVTASLAGWALERLD